MTAERQVPIALLEAVIGHSPTSLTVVGADDRIVFTLGDQRRTDQAGSTYVGGSITDLFPDSTVCDVIDSVRNGAGPTRWEVRHGARTYDTTAVAMPHSVAGAGGVACVATDVTERVAESRRFRALVENIHEVTSILNADGTVRYMSPAFAELSGYSLEEVTGTNGWDLVHPDDVPASGRTFQGVLEQPDVLMTHVFRMRRRNGDWMDVEQSLINRLDDPAIQGIISVARDVTDQRARERQLLALNSLHAVLSECGNLMVRVDDPVELRSEVCRILVTVGGFAAAAFTTVPSSPSPAALVCEYTPPGDEPARLRRSAAMLALVNETDWPPADEPAGRSSAPRVSCESAEALGFRLGTRETPSMVLVVCSAAGASDVTLEQRQMLHGLALNLAFALDSTSVERNRSEAMHLSARRAQQQAVVSRLGFMALGMADTGDILDAAVHSLASFGIRQATVYEALAGGDEVLVRATFGDGVPAARGDVVARPMFPMTAAVLQTGETVRVDDFSSDGRFRRPPGTPGADFVPVGSGLSVPIRVGGATVAALTVYSFDAHDFDSHEMNFFESVAHVISGAMERSRHENSVRHDAMHDRLTGLPNYVLLVDRLTHALSRARRRQTGRVAVLRVDLDGFKLINDTLGRATGDSVLAAVGVRLRAVVRTSDTVAHLGGDEFVVLREDLADVGEAAGVARRINATMREPFGPEGHGAEVTVSIGIAVSGEDTTVEEVLRDADVALHRAKQLGRDRYELFNDDLRQRLAHRVELERGLRRALDREEFVVAYQPVIDLATGDIREAEALLRWTRQDGTSVSPGEFIPVAEETGMIVAIGEWVLQRACHDAVRWNAVFGTRRSVGVAVNLSARQISHPDVVATVVRALEVSGLDPDLLRLEITETALMEEGSGSAETLQALNHLGVHLSVDDFGTGYSSLMYLRQYPVRTLKVDRYFVAGLGTNPADDAIVQAVIALAHSLSLSATAEGVETVEQLQRLRALGCDSGQGFLWSRALPYDEFIALIASLPAARHEPILRLPSPAASPQERAL